MRYLSFLLLILALSLPAAAQKSRGKAKKAPSKTANPSTTSDSTGKIIGQKKLTVSSDSARHLFFSSLVSAIEALEIITTKPSKESSNDSSDETNICGYLERRADNEIDLYTEKDSLATFKKPALGNAYRPKAKTEDAKHLQLSTAAIKLTINIDRVEVTIEANKITRLQLFDGKTLVGNDIVELNVDNLEGDAMISVNKDGKRLFIRVRDLLQFTWRHHPKNLHEQTYILSENNSKITLKNQ